ncbi:MAG: hypothetical protein IPN34_21560 [Planctomycetes bacterium]|nr:hypothetical protein [Planctomycetota bacterium]
MLDPEFLEILACPEDKSPLRMAAPDLVERLNTKITTTKVVNRGGDRVAEAIDAGLVREDGKYLYPVRDEIPILLIEEAIALEGV